MNNVAGLSNKVAERRLGSGAVLKTYFILVFFLALKAGGNSAMAWGMKQVPERMSMNPALYLRAMLNPFVALGVVALILALLTRMALFSLADLSFVLPVTAVGYVIAVLIGKLFLHEPVSLQRWLGALLIFAGSTLVGSTPRNTTSRDASGRSTSALDGGAAAEDPA
jgi:drug/metabolite transporter (DMT)-like permease